MDLIYLIKYVEFKLARESTILELDTLIWIVISAQLQIMIKLHVYTKYFGMFISSLNLWPLFLLI